MIRRGTAYGPLLPEGVLEDDGADRGLMFAFVGAHLGRQFEFVQSEWINDGVFFGAGDAKDPVVGSNDEGDGSHRSSTAGPPAPSGPPAVRRHAGRRVWLHAGTARPALARRPSRHEMSGCRRCCRRDGHRRRTGRCARRASRRRSGRADRA